MQGKGGATGVREGQRGKRRWTAYKGGEEGRERERERERRDGGERGGKANDNRIEKIRSDGYEPSG